MVLLGEEVLGIEGEELDVVITDLILFVDHVFQETVDVGAPLVQFVEIGNEDLVLGKWDLNNAFLLLHWQLVFINTDGFNAESVQLGLCIVEVLVIVGAWHLG